MRLHFSVTFLAGLLFLTPALAEQPLGNPQAPALPGVEGGYSIVTPAPEPMDSPAATDEGYAKMGDWDLRISGSVMVQVGATSASSDKRRER